MFNRIIGIFIPKHHYQLIKYHDSLLPSYAQYEVSGKFYQLSICFLCTECSFLSNGINGLMRKSAEEKFREMTINIPKIIYNRADLNNIKVRKSLFHFIQSGSKVFNYIPIKNSKFDVNKILVQEKHLIEYIPKTLYGSNKNLKYALQHMENFFIKPCYSSIGKGIMYVEKEEGDGNWYLYERNATKKNWEKRLFNTIENKRINMLFKQRSFIIQERIQLATFQNRPFDLRVIVQKDGTDHWIITGMIAKLAPEGQLLTNVGRGGQIGDLHDYFNHYNISISETTKKINALSLDIAKALEKTWPHISDLGLDIGITNKGAPYFIECNLRGQYAALRKEKRFMSLWEKTHDTPIAYADYLFDQK